MSLRLNFTLVDGKKITIFVDHIVSIAESYNNQTTILTTEGSQLINKPYEEVLQMLP